MNQLNSFAEYDEKESSGLPQDEVCGAHNLDRVPRKKKAPFPPSSDGIVEASNVTKRQMESETLSSLAYLKKDDPIPRKKRSADNIGYGTNRDEADNSIIPMDRSTTEDLHGLYRTTDSSVMRLLSEKPFIIKINLREMNIPTQGPAVKRSRSISAAASIYRELDDSDSDDYKMSEEEERKLLSKRLKKKNKHVSVKSQTLIISPSSKSKTSNIVVPAPNFNLPMGESTVVTSFADNATTMDSIEAPPSGVLSTLWYSRECFNYVWVMEKICGWKTRPVFTAAAMNNRNVNIANVNGRTTESGDNNQLFDEASLMLDTNTAIKIQQAVLQSFEYTTDASCRIEVSRINPQQCPVIQSIATSATLHSRSVTSDHRASDSFESTVLQEEVLLVKWRGRSYYHCSWERASDIERLDSSGNSTAKNKVKRFYLQQDAMYGPQWKQLLDEERKAAARIHHGSSDVFANKETVLETNNGGDQVEEFFSPQCLMVERILACDENEMDMQVLARQRAINMREERMEEFKKEKQELQLHSDFMGANGSTSKLAMLAASEWEVPFDPEDNVRYVVKWKGLPYADITWEYWRDIKHDAVEEVEDFWYRQIPPDLDYAWQCSNRPHPHMKDFKKLQESYLYGVSKKLRPVANLEDSNDVARKMSLNSTTESESGGFRLRSYQLEGLNWLLFNWWNRRSCILADEMGLGKTIQSAAFLQELQSQPASQVRGPFLIVAPLSLIDQWQSELRSWAPDMNVILYHGSADARDFLVKHEFFFTDQFIPKADSLKLKKFQATKFHVLITTYEVVLKDITVLSKIRWKTLIVDEAHRLKNYKSRLFLELSTFPRDHCVLLTGTPIANSTEELWALLHFANPEIFYDRDDFLAKFGEMTDVQQVNELHALLKPYLLRRVKEDVEKSLPNKEETILEVSLTPIQKTFYKAIYERNTSFLFKGAKANNAPSLMNVMMELRKCCNHPFLIKGAEDRILADAASKAKVNESGGGENELLDQNRLYAEQLVKSSGKMVLMEKLLNKLFDGGHKVLVFSQMVRVLDLLEDLLKIKKYRYERLDGSTSSSSRLHAVERFKKKECNRFVMLLSTRAGGLGLNLTVADIVIIFDSDWNPQNDMQAMARAHRIGQTKAVKVYRFLTAKTYEMHMFHSASLKLGLERAVMSQNREQTEENDEGTKTSKKSNREAQAKEIDQLLKKGAYDVFRDDDDTEAERFMETDIDQLLEHSSKTVSYGTASTSSLGSGLGSFSKASFVASTDDGAKDVDLDDPDFWSKAVGLDTPPAEIPDDIAAMIDDGVKRSRKQVEQYDPYAESSLAEQMKNDQLELERMLEEEERERIQAEKTLKPKKGKDEKRKLNRDGHSSPNENRLNKINPNNDSSNANFKAIPRPSKELKPKNGKTRKRALALRRAENEYPLIEQFKQAWEIPQRNRATAAAIRFGFGRFCKLRNEANLSSLPLQDLEVFMRSYCYQISLQISVTLMKLLRNGSDLEQVRAIIRAWLGVACDREVNWICDSVQSVLKFQVEVESYRSFLRLPIVLTESTYVRDLRHGAGFRALRRIGLLARLNHLIAQCVDEVILCIGPEELGKRGCNFNELDSLDLDQKSRFISNEELTITIGSRFRRLYSKRPALWWDRSCDVGLILGTFVHGLSNYESMRRDRSLPFGERISQLCKVDLSCKLATERFCSTAEAAQRVFEDALEAGRVKAELEVQAAVAAASKAARQREVDAALLRKGGVEAEGAVRNMPDTQVDDAFEFDGTDTHFVTLPRMHKSIQQAAIHFTSATSLEGTLQKAGTKFDDDTESPTIKGQINRIKEHHLLPLPDARILDHRFVLLIREMEKADTEDICEPNGSKLWQKSIDVATILQVRDLLLSKFDSDAVDVMNEYRGVGLSAIQCGISHRTLNDGSDYSFGSANNQIAQLAYGTDAPRYLRALCVPMNVTRFAISSLLYSDFSIVKSFMLSERLRYFGKEDSNTTFPCDSTNGTFDSTKEIISDDTWMHSSSRPTILAPADPVGLINEVFRSNAELRAYVCYAVGFFGFPPSSATKINMEVWAYTHGTDDSAAMELFDIKKFQAAILKLDPDIEVPDAHKLSEYVENILLPHCLRLCVYGNGPSTRNARGSHGDYETAFGIGIHPEPSLPHPSPLPDPCLRLQEHSLEAIGFANAILRRVRLLRSCIHQCSMDSDQTISTLVMTSKSMVIGRSLHEMPIWWCPWIHDVALLQHAATHGLFSLILSRTDHPVFSTHAIETFVRTKVASDNLSKSRRLRTEQLSIWSEEQSKIFPTLYQLERRLGLYCGELTVDLQNEYRFDYIPMFDHGGWPRK